MAKTTSEQFSDFQPDNIRQPETSFTITGNSKMDIAIITLVGAFIVYLVLMDDLPDLIRGLLALAAAFLTLLLGVYVAKIGR